MHGPCYCRSLGAVVRRAWELGATNDMWWLDTGGAYDAWNRAIDEAGLSWKYRQVLGGEWNALEALGDARFRKQGACAFRSPAAWSMHACSEGPAAANGGRCA